MAEQMRNLKTAVTLAATRVAGGVQVVATNAGAGHSFPTGVSDLREPWVEVDQVDATGTVVQQYGAPGSDGMLPSDAARLGTDIADANGDLLLRHELSVAARVPFEVRIPARGAQSLFVPVPAGVPTSSLRAVLYFRNVRTTDYPFAMQGSTGNAPSVEMARAQVQGP